MLHEKDLDSVSDTGFLEEKVQVLPIKPTTFWLLVQDPLVRKVDNAIRWINLYPVDNAIISRTLTHWIVIYPVDSAIERLNNRSQMLYHWATGD